MGNIGSREKHVLILANIFSNSKYKIAHFYFTNLMSEYKIKWTRGE